MSLFHFCLSAAKNLSSFQLLPASLITDHISIKVQENFPLQPVTKEQKGSKVYLYSFFNIGAR